MTSPEWEAANEDDADRWTRYQAHTGLAPDDGLVWRDRGVIIAQQQTKIAQLEAFVDHLRNELVEKVESAAQRFFAAVDREQEAVTRAENAEARIGELELACQKLRDDYQGALARETALRGRTEALADGWASIPDYEATHYDRGRVDQRRMAETELRAALAASPTQDTPPAAPHAEDGADAGDCSNNDHVCSCWPDSDSGKVFAHDGDCNIWLNDPAPVADRSAEDGD